MRIAVTEMSNEALLRGLIDALPSYVFLVDEDVSILDYNAAAATVLAMIPLTRSVFWGPMAIAIMGGLTIATLLTIFFVPALYAAWFRVARQSAPETSAVAADPALAT